MGLLKLVLRRQHQDGIHKCRDHFGHELFSLARARARSLAHRPLPLHLGELVATLASTFFLSSSSSLGQTNNQCCVSQSETHNTRHACITLTRLQVMGNLEKSLTLEAAPPLRQGCTQIECQEVGRKEWLLFFFALSLARFQKTTQQLLTQIDSGCECRK